MEINIHDRINNYLQSSSSNNSQIYNPQQMIDMPYKDRYIQGLEERLNLHTLLCEKDNLIKDKERMLMKVIEHIKIMENSLSQEPSTVAPNVPQTQKETVVINNQPAPLVAWVDLAWKLIPEFPTTNLYIFDEFISDFLKSNSLVSIHTASLLMPDFTTFAIPSKFQTQFIDELSRMFTKNTQSKNIPSNENEPMRVAKSYTVKGISVTIWTDLVRSFNSQAMSALNRDPALFSRASNSIVEFLNSRLPSLGLSLEAIKVKKVITIPKALEAEFISWFKENYKSNFAHLEKSRKRKNIDISADKNEGEKFLKTKNENNINQKVEEKVIEEGVSVPLVNVKNTGKGGMTRYNVILKSLMPTYNSMPKNSRMEIKSKLGGEEKLPSCIMWARANNQLFSTYGIPKAFEKEFKIWAIKKMRNEFGVEQVPMEAWEE